MLLSIGCTSPDRHDVILIVVDTLRADHLGVYGYGRKTSPLLDAFARNSIVFDDVVSPAPWTLPAVGSMLTSTYPSVHGLRSRSGESTHTSMRDGLATLADAFAAAGYRTAAVGTNPWISEGHGLQRGFEEFRSAVRKPGRVVNDLAREILTANDPRPLFLYLHYMDVHGPYRARNHPGIPDLGPLDDRYVRKITLSEDQRLNSYLRLRGVDGLEGYVDAYDRGIRLWDRHFGDLMTLLEESGRLEGAIVSVVSDHGEEFLEHGGWNHGLTVYEDQVAIPWILRAPGSRGRRFGGLTSLIDVAPTLLALAGVEVPDSMAGLDLFEGEGPGADRSVYSETHIRRGGASRDDGSSLVAMRRGDRKWVVDRWERRCFDLEADPLEQRDADCDGAGFEELARWVEEIGRQGEALGSSRGFAPTAEEQQHLRELGYVE